MESEDSGRRARLVNLVEGMDAAALARLEPLLMRRTRGVGWSATAGPSRAGS